jgi:predicted transcriptional regulator
MEQKLYIYSSKVINDMDTQADLKWIHQELDNVKDPTLLKAIKNILKNRKSVTSGRIGIEQYNKEIDASIRQIETGKTYTHQEVGERIKQWGKQ